MNEMNITMAQYNADPINGTNVSINVVIGGVTMSVPLDPANRHYAEIMRQVKDGTLVIQPADEPPQEEPPDYVPAIDQLRSQRDQLLSETDVPWGLADYTHPNKQAWLDYRQALRDLPSTQTPELDENGNLINVNWPEKP